MGASLRYGHHGGVHTYQDVLKGLMAGAKITMMASELLQNGPGRLGEILATWPLDEEHEYGSVAQLQGSMSQQKSVTRRPLSEPTI